MKRILALLMAVAMVMGCILTLAACATEDAVSIEQATKYFKEMYKTYNNSEFQRDYDLVEKVVINQVVFTVAWTCDNADIKIVDSKKEGYVTVDLPAANTEAKDYKLTATLTSPSGKTATYEITATLPVFDFTGQVFDPEENTPYYLFLNQVKAGGFYFATGEVSGRYLSTVQEAKDAAEIYAEKADDGFKFYIKDGETKKYLRFYLNDEKKTSIDFNEEGTVWTYVEETNSWNTVTDDGEYYFGTYNTYTTFSISAASYISATNTGISQFPGGLMEKEHALTIKPDVETTVPGGDKEVTVKEFIDIANALESKGNDAATTEKYIITGKIDEVYNDQYGNMYLVDEAGNKLTIHGTFNEDGSKKYSEMDYKPVAGDTITLVGVASYYNGAQMKNGWITKIVKGDGTVIDPPAPSGTFEPVKPEAGTGYFLGMAQGNKNNTVYYIIGGMNGYYMATSDKSADAVKAYVEASGDGFQLYILVGEEKSYINVVKSEDGAHVNAVYGNTAVTVYTYNETLKTLTTVLDEKEYALGTRNDKEYTTIGPVEVSKDPFIAQFSLTAGTVGGSTDNPPAADTFAAVKPEVGTAYNFSMDQTVAGGRFYITSGMAATYYLASDKDVTKALKFYVEAVDGGYNLYAMDGTTKSYVNFVVDGSHVNAKYQDAAATVYTYDETLKTLKTSIDGKDYVLGTRNDKNYSTFGPVEVSKDPFYGQFSVAK